MTLEDLKNGNKPLIERAKGLLEGKGIDESMAVNASSLKKGDTFKLTGLEKVELARQSPTFQPVVFTTNRGAQIGTKHFASVDLGEDDAPALGRTAIEVASFCAYCIEHDVEFIVKKIELGEPRQIPGEKEGDMYTPKTFILDIA